jgi:hypothetical protein
VGELEVLAHQMASGGGIATADGIVEDVVRFVFLGRDVGQGALDPDPLRDLRLAQELGHPVEDAVVRGAIERLVEVGRDLRGRPAPGDRPLQPFQRSLHPHQVVVVRALRREHGQLDLDDHPRLEQFEHRLVGEGGEEGVRIDDAVRLADVVAAARSDLDHPNRGQSLHRLAKHRPADRQLAGQLVLRGERVAWLNRAALQILEQLLHHRPGQGLPLDRLELHSRPTSDWASLTGHTC